MSTDEPPFIYVHEGTACEECGALTDELREHEKWHAARFGELVGLQTMVRDLYAMLAAKQAPVLALTIEEACVALGGISRPTIYNLIRSGKLATVTMGTRRVVAVAELVRFLAESTDA